MFLTDESLDNAKITHGFFGRRGGGSGGIYESLNCGVGTQDAAENVARNRALVCAALGAVPEKLVTLYQVHSATCVRVHESLAAADRPRADAMVSDVPGLVLGILTADCAPVLLYGEKSGGAPVIGAAHAGWGGALKGVLESTVAEMKRRGASEGSLRAVVGPCIRQESYEVGEVRATGFPPSTSSFSSIACMISRTRFARRRLASFSPSLGGRSSW